MLEENLLNLYREILELTEDIEKLIDLKEWNKVEVLLSKRAQVIKKASSLKNLEKNLTTENKKTLNDLVFTIQKLDKELDVRLADEKKGVSLKLEGCDKLKDGMSAYKLEYADGKQYTIETQS